MNIKNIIIEEINNYNQENSIIDSLLERVPFFKHYNIVTLYDKDNKIGNIPDESSNISESLQLERHNEPKDKNFTTKDSSIILPSFSVMVEFKYLNYFIDRREYPNDIFYIFNLKFDHYFSIPKNVNQIELQTLIIILQTYAEKHLSYHNEIHIKEGDPFPLEKFNQIINELNKTLFEQENYMKEQNLKF
jgi:hypothetical protein